MLEGERLACDGRQCFTHFYYIIAYTPIGIGPSIFVNDSSARGPTYREFVMVSIPRVRQVAAPLSTALLPGEIRLSVRLMR